MTNETKKNYLAHKPATEEALNVLMNKGFNYLQVQGFTLDHHPEYVEPNYLMLVPFKNLSELPASMDIYEPINSELIKEWISAKNKADMLEIYLAY